MQNDRMMAVVTTGHGGYDKLEYKEVSLPRVGEGEVLVKVLAAGINNTEINTRLGWYSSTVSQATSELGEQETKVSDSDGGWDGTTPFPLIQGTDCCGRVEQVAEGGDRSLLNRRVLIRPCIRLKGFDSLEHHWMGSNFDGAFAQFVKVPASEVFPVDCDWSDAELATIPCAYGTAENMLIRAAISADDTVLVIGASGGVGSAALQLAKLRGARVIGVAGSSKHPQLESLGAEKLLPRDADLLAELGESSVDLVVDNVAGSGFSQMPKLLRPGGRLVTSGAIAGPVVELDLRELYLKDLTLLGSTAWDEAVFPNLVRFIEQGRLQPLLAGSYPLEEIARAQQQFLTKQHVGKMVLIPSS